MQWVVFTRFDGRKCAHLLEASKPMSFCGKVRIESMHERFGEGVEDTGTISKCKFCVTKRSKEISPPKKRERKDPLRKVIVDSIRSHGGQATAMEIETDAAHMYCAIHAIYQDSFVGNRNAWAKRKLIGMRNRGIVYQPKPGVWSLTEDRK